MALLLVATATGLCEQKGNAKAPPARNPAPPRANVPPPRGPVGVGGAPKLGPRLTNPNNPLERLYRATPEQRERVLEKLPPLQQERARKNLEWFDRLPKEQQQMVLQRADRLAALPPEKRLAFQQSLRSFQQLPQDRKAAIGVALRRLQVMPEDQRNRVLSSDQFRVRFSPEERKIILDLSEVMLPPA